MTSSVEMRFFLWVCLLFLNITGDSPTVRFRTLKCRYRWEEKIEFVIDIFDFCPNFVIVKKDITLYITQCLLLVKLLEVWHVFTLS